MFQSMSSVITALDMSPPCLMNGYSALGVQADSLMCDRTGRSATLPLRNVSACNHWNRACVGRYARWPL